MNNAHSFRSSAVAVLGSILISTALGSAALAGPPMAPRAADGALSADDFQRFRDQLTQVLDSYEQVMQATQNADGLRQIQAAKQQLAQVTPEDAAAVLTNGAPDLSGLVSAAEDLRSNVDQAASAASGPRPESPLSLPFPGLPTQEPAVDAFCMLPHGPTIRLVALDAKLIAEGILKGIERSCDEVLVVLGEGGNLEELCTPLEIIAAIAEAVFENAEFCANEDTALTVEGSFERLEHIHEDLEDDTNEIIMNDNENRDKIIENDNENRDLIVKNDNTNKDRSINELQGLACEIIRLMNTPAEKRSSAILSCGARPGFPYRWPKGSGSNKSASLSSLDETVPQSAGDKLHALSEALVEDGARTGTGSGSTKTTTSPAIDESADDGAALSLLSTYGMAFLEAQILDCRLLPTLYLPAERGGSLEEVQHLVWEEIRTHDELKLSQGVSLAREAAGQADQLLTQKQYLAAYREYCIAFQKLIPAS
jgi:hypothetical protein